MTETTRVDIGNAELHVEITGSGPDLLLVAGLGGRGAFWNGQVAAFAEHFRVIVHDHRGCGASTRGLTVDGVPDMARDVIKLMDALGVKQAHYVGHSTGGAMGQWLALEHADRIDKLVLSCSWPGPDAYFTQLFETRRAILTECGPDHYLASGTFLAMPARVLQPALAATPDYFAERRDAFPGLDVELSRIAAVMDHDLRDRVGKIGHETLCIGAQDDQITPPGFSAEMAAAIPGATLHLLPTGGHFAPIAARDAYNARVLSFLTGEDDD